MPPLNALMEATGLPVLGRGACRVGTGGAALCHFHQRLGSDGYLHRDRSGEHTPLACSRPWWAFDRRQRRRERSSVRQRGCVQAGPIGDLPRDCTIDDHRVRRLPHRPPLLGKSSGKGAALRPERKALTYPLVSSSSDGWMKRRAFGRCSTEVVYRSSCNDVSPRYRAQHRRQLAVIPRSHGCRPYDARLTPRKGFAVLSGLLRIAKSASSFHATTSLR
ncbi:hypothetical protein J2T07_000587 [Luteibacter jiangsuensis]|uniref:Uncharacterized protein n=1 Tax=Luteibacter jiangsuensis TaxID=637577 RepID=A0ABT9STW0_9GAMM|nr:hypothetical protein [Luteibacter jiangsuensis]